VCATPRSGSTLLCELLKDTGVAGRPEEYFEARIKTGLPPHPGDYLTNLPRTGVGIRDNPAPPRAPAHSSLIGLSGYQEHLERTLRLGTTDNGVFAAKLMWSHLPDMQTFIRELPEYGELTLPELLDQLFGRPRYVWVTRGDKVRQAVSLWKALQSRSWRLENVGADGRRAELLYRFQGIDHLVRLLRTEDDAWSHYFALNGIDALKLSYEEHLAEDRDAAVRAVLDHIGVPMPEGWKSGEVMQRQADALSEEWVAAYHRDAAERSWQASPAVS
jgi:LPS sulfotransferase NodH